MNDTDNSEAKKALAEKWKRIGMWALKIAGGAVVFIALLELGLHAARALFPQQAQEDTHFALTPYKDKPWANQLFKDQVAVGNVFLTFDRYDEWKRPAVSTTYVNVDQEGRRKTWNPEVATGTKQEAIWFMGGSSAFGAGARDEYTIPSDLSKTLNAKNSTYQVSNYGTYAYVIPQSVVQLVKLLEAGERPDYLILYGGAGDVNGAFDAGKPGAVLAEDVWKSRINDTIGQEAETVGKELLRDNCLTCRLAVNFARSIDPSALRVTTIQGMQATPDEITSLAEGVSQNYLGTLAFVDHLATAYHFKYLAVWEPSPFGDRLVGDEQKLPAEDWRLSDKNNAALHVQTTALLDKAAPPHWIDLSGLLKPRTEMLFLDDTHITEDGDQIVAQKIADVITGKTAK